jgi:hypothetical protein
VHSSDSTLQPSLHSHKEVARMISVQGHRPLALFQSMTRAVSMQAAAHTVLQCQQPPLALEAAVIMQAAAVTVKAAAVTANAAALRAHLKIVVGCVAATVMALIETETLAAAMERVVMKVTALNVSSV